MPSGWDWGSMWLAMLLPGIAIVASILIVVFFLLRREGRLDSTQTLTYSPPQSHPVPEARNASIQGQLSKPGSEVVGKVVLSLAPTLMDDERRVMDELAKAGGEMLQSSLPEMTGYSKATVSKGYTALKPGE